MFQITVLLYEMNMNFAQDVPVLEYLIASYPEYKKVGSFPIEGDKNKVNCLIRL